MRGVPSRHHARGAGAAHLHFHTDAKPAALARAAGFRDVAAANDDGGRLLTGRA